MGVFLFLIPLILCYNRGKIILNVLNLGNKETTDWLFGHYSQSEAVWI